MHSLIAPDKGKIEIMTLNSCFLSTTFQSNLTNKTNYFKIKLNNQQDWSWPKHVPKLFIR